MHVIRLAVIWVLIGGFQWITAADDVANHSQRVRIPIGCTAKLTEMIAVLDQTSSDSKRLQIVLIGGLDGRKESTAAIERQLKWFDESAPAELRKRIVLNAVPNARPDGNAADAASPRFPPEGGFYDAPVDRESRYLWRWLAMQAPDLVIDVRAETADNGADSLTKKLTTNSASETGVIPAISVVASSASGQPAIDLAGLMKEHSLTEHSPAFQELQRRQARSAEAIAADLLAFYGRDLKQVQYIPALAVVGRQRYAQLTSDADQKAILNDIMQPFLKAKANPIPKSGGDQAGYLIFAELASQADGKERERWTELACQAADQAFHENGEPRGLAPFHNEMSDAVFMSGPILAAAGKLTGKSKYYDACHLHLTGMRKLCLREDGLYRHSPMDQAAWGRGNGFPALGMSWAISHWPANDPRRLTLTTWQSEHLRTLLKHQDHSGCWHQVIDYPISYREFTCTAMISFAMWRGIREGYLERAEFEPAAKRGWRAIKSRIGPQGRLVDVCVGTGKQKALRDYLERPANWGVDPRGGAMALLLATEVMACERQNR